MSITFDVNDKAKHSLGTEVLPTISVKESFGKRLVEKQYDDRGYIIDVELPKVEATGNTSELVIDEQFSHPFVEAIHTAFQHHYPLILTPDSIWLCIAQGFSHHVNVNAETLRSRFVAHEGKELIKIYLPFSKGSPNNDWGSAFSQFSDKLAEHIGKKRDLIVSNFSTTTAVERAASEVVLMDAMKAFFKFAGHTDCGIPSVTLEGTVDDWRSIRTRVENLAEYDLDWWVKALIPVCDKLVASAEGNPDIEFWNSLYKENNQSGGPFAEGWFNTLFPYIEDESDGSKIKNDYAEDWKRGGWGDGPTTDAFPNGLSRVPFKWQYHDSVYDMEFLGGFSGASQNAETLAITPTVGWAIRELAYLGQGKIDEKKDW